MSDGNDEGKSPTAAEEIGESASVVNDESRSPSQISSLPPDEKSISELVKRAIQKTFEEQFATHDDHLQDAFVAGSTPFETHPGPDGMIRRLLCRNNTGYVVLAVDTESLNPLQSAPASFEESFARRQQWFNVIANGTLEVESLEIGEGKRSQSLPNSKGFHLAWISAKGFVLGRMGIQAIYGDADTWLPSVLEYRPFASFMTPMPKAHWDKVLPNHETLNALTCGDNHVAALSEAPQSYIRIFSLAGVLLYVASCQHGVPVTVCSRNNCLILLEASSAGLQRRHFKSDGSFATENLNFDRRYLRLQQKPYKASLYLVGNLPMSEVGSWVHLINRSSFVLYGSEKVIWTGLTDSLMSVLVTSHHRCLALCVSATGAGFVPKELDQLSAQAQISSPADIGAQENADVELMCDRIEFAKAQLWRCLELEWTPVSDPLDTIFPKISEREDAVFYPLNATMDHLSVIICKNGSVMPAVPLPGQKSCSNKVQIPLRIPLALPEFVNASHSLPLSLHKWAQLISADPRLTEDKTILKSLHLSPLVWQQWDEIRHRRLRLGLAQQLWVSSLLANEDSNAAAVREGRKSLELANIRQVMKLLNEGIPDTVLEVASHLAFGASLTRVVKQCQERGERTLSELLTSVVEHKEMIKEMRQSLSSNTFPYETAPRESTMTTTAAAAERASNRSSGADVGKMAAPIAAGVLTATTAPIAAGGVQATTPAKDENVCPSFTVANLLSERGGRKRRCPSSIDF